MPHLYTTMRLSTKTTTIRKMHDVGKLRFLYLKGFAVIGAADGVSGRAAPVDGRFRGRLMQPGGKWAGKCFDGRLEFSFVRRHYYKSIALKYQSDVQGYYVDFKRLLLTPPADAPLSAEASFQLQMKTFRQN